MADVLAFDPSRRAALPGAMGMAAPPQAMAGQIAGQGQVAQALPVPDTRDAMGDYPGQDYAAPLDINELRKQFTDYVTIKQTEILEARNALQYYHGDQWTAEQIKVLQARGQPVITFNRIGRKIDGMVGVLEKLRGDPKAFGARENDEHGAELATQCIRYAFERSRFHSDESEALRLGGCTGIIVAEHSIEHGDKGDLDISIHSVDGTTFFYDPRSVRLDFSDCRYMGVSKLVTEDEMEELFPGQWGNSISSVDDTGQTMFDYDRFYLWSMGRTKIRLVEHWYRSQGEWHFAFYAGSNLLASGPSPYFDENGGTLSRYEAFAVHVDTLGEHYGFVRNLIGPQDAMNQHRSKSVHIMNTRTMIANRSVLGGDTQGIEDLRREGARPDGVILYDGDVNAVRFEQQSQEFIQQTQYYGDAKQEIDAFGPNPALAFNGAPADVSGRSIAMQSQAGLAELGTFLSQWRAWKLRLYRKTWVAQQRYWTAERILRVTNDQGVAQYVAINKLDVDQFGRPMLVNAIGQIDVDILIDEGPDTQNVMGDVNDTLIALAHNNVPVPPAVLIETSPLPQSKKQQLIGMLQQPNPAQQAAQQAQIENVKADTAKKAADAQSSQAAAVHKLALAHHETQKAHSTQTGTAIDTMNAIAPQIPPGAAPQVPGGPTQPVQGQQAPVQQPGQGAGPPGQPQGGPSPPQGLLAALQAQQQQQAQQQAAQPLPGGPVQVPPGFDAPRQQMPAFMIGGKHAGSLRIGILG